MTNDSARPLHRLDDLFSLQTAYTAAWRGGGSTKRVRQAWSRRNSALGNRNGLLLGPLCGRANPSA